MAPSGVLNLAVSHRLNVSWSTVQHQFEYKANTELAVLIKCKYILKLKRFENSGRLNTLMTKEWFMRDCIRQPLQNDDAVKG